jgi:hypothetical protein
MYVEVGQAMDGTGVGRADVVGKAVGIAVGEQSAEPLLPSNICVVVTDETSQHRS